MPALAPLLSPEVSGTPETSKKTPRKLRRKNPPPSLSNQHQKLPSETSSMISAPNSRPTTSRSMTSPKSGGWFSRGRKSMDNTRNEWVPDESQRPPMVQLPHDLGLGADAGNGGVLTPPQSGSPTGPSMQQYKDSSNGPAPTRLAITPLKTNPKTYSISGSTTDSSSPGFPLFPSAVPSRREGVSSPVLSTNTQYPMSRPKPRTIPIDDEFLLPPTAPFSGTDRSSSSMAASDSPVLPPLPQFQSGSLGLMQASSSVSSQESMWKDGNPAERPPLSPKHPGRKARSRSASRSPQRPEAVPSTQKSIPTSPLRPHTPPAPTKEPVDIPVDIAAEVPTADADADINFPFHAVTAEEPIVLPTRSSTRSSEEASKDPSPPPPETKKKERRGSFLGGWKLAMKSGGRETPVGDAPVGVGSGGGWIYRRRNSFSSPRPPSAEKAQHSSYAQEYKEFRKQKAAEQSTQQNTPPSSAIERSSAASPNTFAARAAAAGVKPSEPEKTSTKAAPPPPPPPPAKSLVKTSGSTRKNFKEKMKSVEARFNSRNSNAAPAAPSPPPPVVAPDTELVGLDVAVRQMNLLEEQLKSGRPPSPPDSRDGEKAAEEEPLDTPVMPLNIAKPGSPTASVKGDSSSRSSLRNSTGSCASFVTARSQPAPPPSSASHKKTKSLSPLRNEVDAGGGTPSPPQSSKGVKEDKGKGKETIASSSRHSLNSVYVPPSEYLGKSRASTIAGGSSRPPTPPKPVAKLFVICCRCKYWHDLPSAMYRGMVENGGATRCPYCLHGMETACCSGYTCVVYMHQRHH